MKIIRYLGFPIVIILLLAQLACNRSCNVPPDGDTLQLIVDPDAEIINRINKGFDKIKVIVDCPSPSILKWGDFLKTKIKNLSNLEFSCEHKADKNHLSVSAASILAKSVREKEMKKLREKYGEELGSGYTSDPLTKKFLEKYAIKYKDEGLFRKTWITWKNAYNNLNQRKLF